MTNYRTALIAIAALFAGACSAAETPVVSAAPKPAAAAQAPAAAPAPAPAPAPTATALPRYTQSAANSSLNFTFKQEGAATSGTFRKFSTVLVYDEKNLAASSLNVRVEMASVDAQDQERNDMLKDADLFNVAKFPAATYTASSLAKRADGGIEAVGKLTIRDVTHDLRLPLTLKPTANGLELSGKTSFKRLDYGVGQGEWKATESVGNEVTVEYKVSLARSRAAP